MNSQTILFVINPDTADKVIAEAAEAAAQDQTHLSCLLLGAAPALPIYALGVPPYGGMNVPDNWGELVEAARQNQNDRVQAIEAVLARSGVSGDVQAILCATMEMKDHVARRARVCDMAHISPNLRDTPEILREAAHGVLFQSPVGLRLNGPLSLEATRIFVAWDSSKAASRSVHVALPHLKEAEEVIIGCFDPVMTAEKDGLDPGTDLAAWLSHHGCNVTVSQYPSGGNEIGQCIQDRSDEIGADLVVMGAYGHARMVQTVFGGTTRTMFEQVDLPVLLTH